MANSYPTGIPAELHLQRWGKEGRRSNLLVTQGYPLGLICSNVERPATSKCSTDNSGSPASGVSSREFAIQLKRPKNRRSGRLPKDLQDKINIQRSACVHLSRHRDRDQGLVPDNQHRRSPAVPLRSYLTPLLWPVRHRREGGVLQLNRTRRSSEKWAAYVRGDPQRQGVLAVALAWVAASQGINVDALHGQTSPGRHMDGLKTYFTSVIDWIGSVFTRSTRHDMQGLEWGRLYETYHGTSFNSVSCRRGCPGRSCMTPLSRSRKGIASTCSVGRPQPDCSDPPLRRPDKGLRLHPVRLTTAKDEKDA